MGTRIHMSRPETRKSYKPRFQTRKNRSKVTNYRKRTKMLRTNLKNYSNIKTRMVVRFTNSKVICQLIKAYTTGDKIILSATSDELKQYGLQVGLTNYSAAYGTGLLLAKKAMITNNFTQEDLKADSEDENARAKYRVFLDIGLKRNTRGSKAYAALKGAVDSGLDILHNAEKIFYSNDSDKNDEEDNTLYCRIHGKTVGDYMKLLREEDNAKYTQQFSQFIANNINEDNIEEMYKNVFEQVRNITTIQPKEKKEYKKYV